MSQIVDEKQVGRQVKLWTRCSLWRKRHRFIMWISHGHRISRASHLTDRVPNRSETFIVTALVCLFGSGYALIGLFRHWHFDSSAFDLGIFDQAVWHLSRFEIPASTINGFSNLFGDHFHPILAFFAPLYWLVPAAETLIVAQACLFAGSIVPVFLYLRERLPLGPTLALCTAYGLFWGLQRAAMFDVHEIAFAPVIIATVILAMDRRRWGAFCIATFALMLVKEDQIPFLIFLGLYLLLQGERRRGAILLISSCLAFFLVVAFVIPSLSDNGQYGYTSAYRELLRRPWIVPVALVTPPIKLQTPLLWLAPFAFLPLRSPLSLLVIPFALERLLSDSTYHWSANFHYSASLAPVLVMSAGDGLARIARRIDAGVNRACLIAGLTSASVLLSAVLPGHQPVWRLLAPDHYRQTAFQRTGYQAIKLVPSGASVVAQAAVVPHLSERDLIYILDLKAPDADFVIAAADLSPWPAENYGALESLLNDRKRRGYRVVFSENGWIVLRRQ